MIATHRPVIGEEELSAVRRVFDTGWLGQGPLVSEFEEALRDHFGVPHVVAVSSGTAALHLALEALELPAGTGVIVPSLTFVASVQAILAANLRPVFCEVDAATLQLDLDDVSRCLELDSQRRGGTPPIGVIMPVHFGGASCDMDALMQIASDRRLAVIEDAAHAFGSRRNGRAIGTAGTAGCFSFDPIKTITCGEGGAIATHDAAIAGRARTARMLGIDADGWSRHAGRAGWRYEVRGRGWRYHMPDFNAAVGLVQLTRLAEFRARRQAIVKAYAEQLRDLPGIRTVTRPCQDICPFTYTIGVLGGRREALMAVLRGRGIGVAVEYIPNHLHDAFARYSRPLPVTEQVFDEVLSLPLHAGLRDDEVAAVAAAVCTFVASGEAA